MASTRNKNTTSDYCLEQKQNHQIFGYTEYNHSQYGAAFKNALPTVGITPSHMPREAFSKNSIDIESALFGINSTNLVTPQAPVAPKLTPLPEVAYFERIPFILPNPLVVENKQRPFPVP
jgi:hypothetical protein